MTRFPGVLLAVCVLAPLSPRPATSLERASLEIPRLAQPPSLEDFLTGRNGKSLPDRDDLPAEITDFRQREPGDGVPASQETRAYLSYDAKNLFVVFVCKDDPGKVRARMAKREDIASDDQVLVYLDTFHDGQRAYLFAANPLGVQRDALWVEGQEEDASFDTLWHADGRLTRDGFVVRIAIPFKSIRFPRDSSQSWRIALGRTIPRQNEESFWPHLTKRVEGLVQQFATVEGVRQVSPGRNFQLIPHAMLSRARFLDTEAPAFTTATDRQVGIDGKLVVRDAFALDMTLNPDFSQVESDEPQVTINQRFEVFFPEKRPFFLENAGLFQTPINLFFSRRIVDPQYGARLTGKTGRWAVGALGIDDPAPGKLAPETDPFHDRRAGIGVLRVQREFGEQSNVGLFVTSRDLASTWNRVASLDTRLKLNDNWILSGQAAYSLTKEADGSEPEGPAFLVQLQREGRHFKYVGSYLDLSPSFQSQVGFIERVDVRQTEHEAKYRWRPEKGPVLKFGPSVRGLFNWDRRGRVQDWQVEAQLEFELNGKTQLEIGRTEAAELFEDRNFRKHANTISLSTEWLKWLSVTASGAWGTDINFDPAPGLSPFLARSAEAALQLTLRPTPRFRFDQIFIYGRLTTQGVPGAPGAATVFNNPIARSKLNYQFTRALSVRAILDYEAVLPNTSLVDLEKEKRFAADILLTYLVNPGTAVHLGYTDNYENLLLPLTTGAGLRRVDSPFHSTGRQFFFKVSYLWRP